GMKRREIESKFDEIVDFSGVEKFLDTPLKHYSSGMQLRLAFSVAAFLEPEILVIDEVLAVGDAEFQKKCLGKMEDVTKSGRTILFVSRRLGAVEKLCSRGILVQSGEIGFAGDVDQAVNRYLNPRTAITTINKPVEAPIWIESVSINDASTEPVIYYGDQIKLKIVCQSKSLVKDYVGFVLSSLNGITVLNANNRYQKD